MRTRGELYHTTWIRTENAKMTENTRPSSTLQKNAEVLHTLYGLLDSDREPTDQDAMSLRYLYACSWPPYDPHFQWGQFAVSVHLPVSETQWGRIIFPHTFSKSELINLTVAGKTKLARSKGTRTLLRRHRTRADIMVRRRLRKVN